MIKILITGDFCPINRMEELSLKNKHAKIFNDFLPKIKEVDIAITNLECPLIDEDYGSEKFGPSLKASTKTVKILNFAGFDVVTLSNNHIMDHGEEGLLSTMNLCKKNNIGFIGAGMNLKEASEPFIKNIKGKKIAFFNFAENEFSNTHGHEPGANPLSLIRNYNDIQKVKGHVDSIIVIYHGGNETHNLPSPRLKETLRFFVDSGANAVLAHHTHCVSGYEVYEKAPIFYGLGNFIFDYNQNSNAEWSTGLGVKLIIDDKGVEFELIPFHQNNEKYVGLTLLKGKEKVEFIKKLERLNAIISDDTKLKEAFINFISQKQKQYSHFLEPYQNKILHGLYGRKLIPSLLSQQKRKLYLNLIRCESHRDVLIEILKK